MELQGKTYISSQCNNMVRARKLDSIERSDIDSKYRKVKFFLHTYTHTRARAHARIYLVNAVSQSVMPWPSSHALHNFTSAHLNLTFTVTSNKRTDTARIVVHVPSKHTDTAKIIVRVPGYRSGCVCCRH